MTVAPVTRLYSLHGGSTAFAHGVMATIACGVSPIDAREWIEDRSPMPPGAHADGR